MNVEKMPKIGVIGGGQLGKMLIQKGMQWAVPFVILDKDKDCVSAAYAHKHIVKDIKNVEAIEELANQVDVVTIEIEHTSAEKLIELQARGVKIIPNPLVLNIIQDKGIQKLFYKEHHIPTSPFFLADNKVELLEKLKDFDSEKIVVKSRIGGYDGKGVYINTKKAIIDDVNIVPFDGPLMVEAHVLFKKELAILAAQDIEGNIVVYPTIEMEFDPKNNLVDFLFSPANVPIHIEEMATQLAEKCLKMFDSPGLFAIETFLTEDDQLWVNEIAPRPHNSAHHTIEGFYTSQYEQLLRVLLKLPLGDTKLRMPSAMLNIVASDNQEGHYQLKYFKELSKIKGVYIHLYGKEMAKPNRKLGHVTICLETIEEVMKTAHQIKYLLEIEMI